MPDLPSQVLSLTPQLGSLTTSSAEACVGPPSRVHEKQALQTSLLRANILPSSEEKNSVMPIFQRAGPTP